jgi:hypothetical protein
MFTFDIEYEDLDKGFKAFRKTEEIIDKIDLGGFMEFTFFYAGFRITYGLHHEEFEEVHVCYEDDDDKEKYLQGVWLK